MSWQEKTDDRKKNTKPKIFEKRKQEAKERKAGGVVNQRNVTQPEFKEPNVSLGKHTRDNIRQGKGQVRNLGLEITEHKKSVSGQAQRVPRSKAYSSGKSKHSARLRFRRPIGKKSHITGVTVRGKQYKSERA